MASVTLLAVCATARPWRIVLENCRCARNRSSWGSDLKICLFSENFPLFIAHHQGRDVGGKGHNSRTPNHCGGPKSYNNVISTSFNTVQLRPKDLRFEHGGANLVSYPRRRLTSLHICTSRLSSQIWRNLFTKIPVHQANNQPQTI